MSTVDKSKLTSLQTVYHPMSNQEAVWLKEVAEVEKLLRESDFYMIGARAEAKFLDLTPDPATHKISFTFAVGESFRDAVTLNLRELPGVAAHGEKNYWLEAGEKIIRLWDGPIGEEGSEVLEWFTTEKLIWDRARQRAGIKGFDAYRDAAVYELLYVGIAKVGDSFGRLIKQGHKARMEILANEPQRFAGSRITDETYLFLFAVNPMTITAYDAAHEFTDEEFSLLIDCKRIVADAEKAFVSLLQPDYNVVKFTNYPKGEDGLYGSEYARYSYYINEDMTLRTRHGSFRGRRVINTLSALEEAAFIHVDGDTVKLYVSGVDFFADYASKIRGADAKSK